MKSEAVKLCKKCGELARVARNPDKVKAKDAARYAADPGRSKACAAARILVMTTDEA